MNKRAALVLIACSALIAGCAGTSAIVQSEYRPAAGEKFKLELTTPASASPEGVALMRERLNRQLDASGLLAGAGDAPRRALQVTVTNYYMRHGATRALVGVMAGSDNIQSNVTVKDLASGKTVSEFKVESKNPSAWGTSKRLIEDHADKIVATLKGGKP
jgi:uncharacterized lipoprotein YajG